MKAYDLLNLIPSNDMLECSLAIRLVTFCFDRQTNHCRSESEEQSWDSGELEHPPSELSSQEEQVRQAPSWTAIAHPGIGSRNDYLESSRKSGGDHPESCLGMQLSSAATEFVFLIGGHSCNGSRQ